MITQKQVEVLKTIDQYIKANGISPTNRNLCNLLELKFTSTVHRYLDILEKKGCINRKELISRSITVTKKGRELLKLKDNTLLI